MNRYEILLDAYDLFNDVHVDITDAYAFELYTHDIPNFTFTDITTTRDANNTVVVTFTASPESRDAYARHFGLDDDIDYYIPRV